MRLADADDLTSLADIEEAADVVLVEALGVDHLGAPSDGAWRASVPGFVLVAGRPPVGFAHVLEESGSAHLEQLAVRPDAARRGLGQALLRAACSEAERRGHDDITLTTFQDVPFNRPFYERQGFAVVTEPTGVLARHVRAERRYERFGPRVAMTRRLSPA